MKITKIYPLFLILIVTACGGTFTTKDTSTTSTTAALKPGESEPGARIIFNDTNFTDINDYILAPSTSHVCLETFFVFIMLMVLILWEPQQHFLHLVRLMVYFQPIARHLSEMYR